MGLPVKTLLYYYIGLYFYSFARCAYAEDQCERPSSTELVGRSRPLVWTEGRPVVSIDADAPVDCSVAADRNPVERDYGTSLLRRVCHASRPGDHHWRVSNGTFNIYIEITEMDN